MEIAAGSPGLSSLGDVAHPGRLPKSTSSAMPDLDSPTVPMLKASVHKRLSVADCARISLNALQYRPLKTTDVEEMMALHTEWFPVTYDEAFYTKSVNGEIFTLAAVHSSTSHSPAASSTAKGAEVALVEDAVAESEDLLGIVTMSTCCEHHGDDISTVLEADCETLCQHGGRGLLSEPIPPHPQGCLAYILTLGVIDGYRRRGLARELLKRSIQHVDEEMPHVQAVYLHVVTYNSAAIELYESMSFLRVAHFPSFYRLHGKMYDSFLYALYLHGHRPSWTLRLRKLLGPWREWLFSAWTSFFCASNSIPAVAAEGP